MALDDDVQNLACVPFFKLLNGEALRLIAFSSELRILRAGDILFRKGESSDGGFVVLTGSIGLDPSPKDGRVTHIIRPSSLLGALALITPTLHTSTALAREPTSVLWVSRHVFYRALREFPQCAERLRQTLALQMHDFIAELIPFAEAVVEENSPFSSFPKIRF